MLCHRRAFIALTLIVLCLLIGCAPSPTPTPTPTPMPPTPTLVPPTATPIPPTATPKPKVSVPQVTTLLPNVAAMMLTSAGLKVEQVEEPAPSCNPFIRKQEPFAGTEVEAGSVVKIYYCVGPTPTVPPTVTRIPSPTFVPRPSPTSEFPPIPAGMGGLIVINWYGREINYDIGGKLYKIPPSGGRVIIHLAPGKQNYSADIAGYGRAGGTLEIVLGRYITQQWADR